MRRIDENDEFLLSQLLDGDLPADEADALRLRMDTEPALREAFEQLARVNQLLVRRREDQPEVDWDRFHERVMASVQQEKPSRPGIIPLARYLWIGAPLAAAAAVALLFTVQAPEGPVRPGPEPLEPVGRTPIRVAVGPPPAERPTGAPEIDFHRALAKAAEKPATPQVDFVRSERLDQAIRDQDEARRNRPRSLVVKAMRSTASPQMEMGSITEPFAAVTGS